MNASGLVNRPRTRHEPHTTSMTPAAPNRLISSAVPPLGPTPPNHPSSFCAPCEKYVRAAAMRSAVWAMVRNRTSNRSVTDPLPELSWSDGSGIIVRPAPPTQGGARRPTPFSMRYRTHEPDFLGVRGPAARRRRPGGTAERSRPLGGGRGRVSGGLERPDRAQCAHGHGEVRGHGGRLSCHDGARGDHVA